MDILCHDLVEFLQSHQLLNAAMCVCVYVGGAQMYRARLKSCSVELSATSKIQHLVGFFGNVSAVHLRNVVNLDLETKRSSVV